MHKFGSRIFARVCGVQTFLIGQDDQGIGFHQVGHQSTQSVVVAKLNFIVHHRVVFVDDGQHFVMQQSEQGGTGVQITFSIGQVGMREQHLGTAQTVFTQFGFVHLRQTHLTHRSGRLQSMNFLGACGPTQTLHAFGNGAAGHHDDLATVFGHERHLTAPFTDGRFV